jgi:hypothetical protein
MKFSKVDVASDVVSGVGSFLANLGVISGSFLTVDGDFDDVAASVFVVLMVLNKAEESLLMVRESISRL